MNKISTEEHKQQLKNVEEIEKPFKDLPFKTHGDPVSCNLNPLILNNILSCQYFKEEVALKNFNEILEEIIKNVNYSEPWAIGTTGVPSTMFCCLYKLMLLKLTENEVKFIINQAEYPFIRCAGFLYLRYLCEPKHLWDWFSPYILDEKIFQPTSDPKLKMTFGEYVENLLKENDYYGTRLPRIPLQIEREIKAKLISIQEKKSLKKENERNIANGLFQPNSKCKALSFQDNQSQWRNAIIVGVIQGNKQISVRFLEGSDELIKTCEFTENKCIIVYNL
jgi:pre-mRNA-splicing factor 38B